MAQVLKNNRWLLLAPLSLAPLMLALASCVGCASLGGSLLAQSPSAGGATGGPGPASDVQRVAYIEERYRDLPEAPKPKTSSNPLDALSAKNVKSSYKKLVGKAPDSKIARQLFAEAETLYQEAGRLQGDDRKGRYAAAAARYSEAAERWPDSALEEDALFMAGECFFFADDYPEANAHYELLVKQHPNSRHLDLIDAHRFAIAQYWLDRHRLDGEAFYTFNLTDKKKPWYDTDGNAFRVFDRIRLDDPTGKLSDDATLAAANAHFAAGRYLQADDMYADLRKTYPSSEHQFLAHFLGLKAKLNSYQGPDYSGLALDEAEQLIKQIRKNFPSQAEKEKEFLARAYAEVRFKKAERLWAMGRYHELRTEYGAANHYLQQILKDFEDTPFAEEARKHVQENAAKPSTPPQHAAWLVDLFPQRQPAKPLIKSDSPTAGKSRR